MRKRVFTRASIALSVGALAALICGCGSASSPSGSSSTASAPAASTGTASTSSAGSGTATNAAGFPYSLALKYVGGSQGKAKAGLAPIQVGYVEEAPSTQPNSAFAQNAVVAAVDLINGELGGIAGHPIELVKCPPVVTDEDGLQCAEKFANDPAINVVISGRLSVGTTPFWSTLKTKPVVGFQPVAQAGTAKNSFMFGGGIYAFGGIASFLANYAHVKTETSVAEQVPAYVPAYDGFEKTLGALGVKSTTAYYPPAAADMTSSLAASNLSTTQSVFLGVGDDAQCIAIQHALEAFHAAGSVIIGTEGCLDSTVEKALGGIPKWTYWSVEPNIYGTPTPEVKEYVTAMKAYKQAAGLQGQQAAGFFGTTLTLAKWLNELGPTHLTPAAITAKARAFPGPMYLGAPHIKFGVQPTPGVGNLGVRFYTYLGNGKWKDATGGDWVCPKGQAEVGCSA